MKTVLIVRLSEEVVEDLKRTEGVEIEEAVQDILNSRTDEIGVEVMKISGDPE